LSRTDKTKPFWVKLAHGDLMLVEAHDHTAGQCDLPDPYDAFAFSRLTTRCRREFVYTGTETCCCRMCRIVVDYPDRTERHRRRRERRRARRQLRRDWADYELAG
jgi:hypothetical protein